jgi:hypothetical protein
MMHTQLTAQSIWRLAIGLLVAFGLAASVPGWAQSGRGTLTGTVTDTNGAALQGAALNLSETNTGSRYAAVSGPEGLFTFPELPPGSYSLTVAAPGFQSYTQNGITISVGSTATVKPEMKVGGTAELPPRGSTRSRLSSVNTLSIRRQSTVSGGLPRSIRPGKAVTISRSHCSMAESPRRPLPSWRHCALCSPTMRTS